MLPRELEDIFSEFGEDDFDLFITRADFSGDNFIIDFALTVQDINERGGISQKWTIEAAGHRKNHVSFDFAALYQLGPHFLIDSIPQIHPFWDYFYSAPFL